MRNLLKKIKKPRCIYVSLKGRQGEPLGHTELRGRGRFCLHQEFGRLQSHRRFLKANDQALIGVDSDQFEIQVPSTISVLVKDQAIWRAKDKNSPSNIAFSWISLPRNLKLQLENGLELTFDEQIYNPIAFGWKMKFVSALVLAFGFHLGAAQFAAWAAKNSMTAALHTQNVPDIRQVQVGLARAPTPSIAKRAEALKRSPALTADQRRQRRARQLLNQWGVGKPLESADEALPAKTQAKDFFSESFAQAETAHTNSVLEFDFDDQSLQAVPDLNIESQMIAKLLKPSLPKLQDCYDEILLRDSSLTGNPKLWIDFDIHGRVEAVDIENLKSKKKETIRYLSRCFRGVYQNLQLPKKPNQAFSVTRTLILKQRS